MNAIFLSASVPVPGRGDYYDSADPFLIQYAVREFVKAMLGRRLIVWGGHPAITPMIWAVCEDLNVDYSAAVVLYQSKFFEDRFPEENQRFQNVQFVDAIPNNREASLRLMRETMLSRTDLEAAVFIGGMEGILDEHALFSQFHPGCQILPVAAPGGAAKSLAERLDANERASVETLDFAGLFYRTLNIQLDDPRN